MDIAPLKDWAGPMVEIRNSLDPLSEALKKKDAAKAEEIGQRIRRCLAEILELTDEWVMADGGNPWI